MIGYTFAGSFAGSVAVVFAVWCAVMFAESAAVWWSAAFVCSFAADGPQRVPGKAPQLPS